MSSDIHARHPRRDGAQQLVGYRARYIRKLGGLGLVAEDGDDIAGPDLGHIAHVHHAHVHTDAAHLPRASAVYDDVELPGKAPVQAVGVADGYDGQAHVALTGKDAAVAYRIPGVVFGHLGDGNLHFNIGSIPPNLAFENEEGIRETVYEVVSRHNGSISAEHGIGQLKRAHFLKLKDPLELELMGAIKRVFDPKGILNPGKLLAD